MTRAWIALALAGAFALGAATGCGPGVPAEPTWEEDVQPILLANCARCHGYPAVNAAPDDFRLDVYEDDTGLGVAGAGSKSFNIHDQAVVQARMPPSGPLTARQQEILRLWHEQGAPRGSPGPDAGTVDADAGADVDAGGEANAD